MDNRNIEEKIRARIDVLQVEREKYIAETSAKIYGYYAAIGDLEMLLKKSPQEKETEGEVR